MNEPTRLRWEKGSALEHALLGAGVASAASPEARAKTLAALGLAGSATLLAGAAGASSFASAMKLGWAKLLLGLSLVGAIAAVPVGYHFVRRPTTLARPLGRVEVVSASSAAPVALAPAAEAAELEPAADPSPRVSARAPARGRLSHELAALDAARATLAGGDARSALALLDIYAESFPNGRLELEAEVLRIDALAKSGHRDAARQRAGAFLRHHSQSVLASRVRA